MTGDVLVFAEQREGILRKSSLEAVSEGYRKAKELGKEVSAILIGTEDENIVNALGNAGAKKIYIADAPHLKLYSGDGYARVVVDIVKKVDPPLLLFGASAMGIDLAPRVAALLDAGMASDCISLKIENNEIKAVRPIYAGKALITVTSKTKPFIATLRPNVFSVENIGNKPEVEKITTTIEEGELLQKVKEIVSAGGDKVPLTEAKIIVSGGRGMKGPENFKILEELAEAFGPGTAVGASRAAVDEGWRPHSDQVGQTGKTVSPVLYVACGISGAIQHLAGMSSSKVIVAINKDPEAPIFKVADYGIVGDLFEVVPALTEALKKEKSN